MHSKDLHFMKKVFQLAYRAQGFTSPNPMVGAVVVKNNKIIGQGYHRKAGLPHAEVIALNKAGRMAYGATLYVNLEPCCHWGRTPPCVDRIIAAGIKRVVISVKDPNPLVNGRSIRKLKAAGIKVDVGLMKEEGARINEVFFKAIKTQLPFVALKFAQSLDGKITYRGKDSKWITSGAARHRARLLRSFYDAVVVGVNTILVDNPYLDSSLAGKEMTKVVLDPELRIRPDFNIFRRGKVIIVYRKGEKIPSSFGGSKTEFVSCSIKKREFVLKELLAKLFSRGIYSLFVEGGAFTLGSFLKQKVADKIYIFIAKKIIGEQGLESIGAQIRNNYVEIKKVICSHEKDYLFVEGYPSYE